MFETEQEELQRLVTLKEAFRASIAENDILRRRLRLLEAENRMLRSNIVDETHRRFLSALTLRVTEYFAPTLSERQTKKRKVDIVDQ